MPLHILVILVVVGIGSIALLLHLSGRSKPVVLTDSIARAEWAANYPDDRLLSVQTAQDGGAALVQTDAGPGVIWAFGIDTAARHLRDCDIHETDTGLRVDFHDFSAPPVQFTLTSDERALWRAAMEPS